MDLNDFAAMHTDHDFSVIEIFNVILYGANPFPTLRRTVLRLGGVFNLPCVPSGGWMRHAKNLTSNSRAEYRKGKEVLNIGKMEINRDK